jgi:hypothetical protein
VEIISRARLAKIKHRILNYLECVDCAVINMGIATTAPVHTLRQLSASRSLGL